VELNTSSYVFIAIDHQDNSLIVYDDRSLLTHKQKC